MKNSEFIPYNKVPKDNLLRAAKNIKQIKKQKLQELVLSNFLNYFGEDIPDKNLSFSLETIPLLNVLDAVVLATFTKDPFVNSNGYSIAGWASILKTSSQKDADDINIPVIYLPSDFIDTTLEHEKIHICQYLQDFFYPLNKDQLNLMLSNPIDICFNKTAALGKDKLIDFTINATCFKLWIEMEANYHTEKKLSNYELMKKIYMSSNSIFMLDALLEIKSISLNDNDWIKIGTRFTNFCDKLEKEVSWVKDSLMTKPYDQSFHDFILEVHDEVSMDYQFGPIEDDDYSDTDIL